MITELRKTAVVLGGSSGIGRAISQRFASEGWRIIIASPDGDKAYSICQELKGDGHHSVALDVRDDRQLASLVDELDGQQCIDALINSVGVSDQVHVLDSDFSVWDNALQVMLYGTVKTCRALTPFICDGGRIIHITSIHHSRVEKGSSSYGMAKAAITQFTRSLALELASKNILSNTIAPGFVDTPMSVNKEGVNELETEWFYENYIKNDHLPLKRAAQPTEIAGVAYFLAGPDASYITGSVLTVDGGLTVTF